MERIVLTGCEIDPVDGDVVRGARTERLTSRERELLVYLWSRPGRDVARIELLTEVWGYAPTARTRAIDNMVRKLRAKIELDPESPRHLLTVPGGYRFERNTPLAAVDLRYPDPILGREALLAQVEDALATASVALCGPPGIGKTRVAWDVARRWTRTPARYCEVRDARTTDDVLGAVAATAGTGHLPASDRAALLDRVAYLVTTHGIGLLVLDNVEQLEPDALTPLAALPVRLLLTSRHPVPGVEAEQIDVPPLDVEIGCALFMDRARRVWPTFVPEPAVAELVRRVAGLPLAIELAAARTGVMPVAEIATRLAESSTVLGDGLASALSWSWALLSDAERDALGQCAVFAGGFDAAAAVAVIDRGSTALDLVQALLAKGLLQSERGGPGAEPGGRPLGSVRLGLLVGVAEFVEANTPAERRRLAADRHLRWFASRVREDARGTCASDLHNAMAAFRRALVADPATAARLAFVLAHELQWRFPMATRLGWLREALAAGPPRSERVLVRGKLADGLTHQGDRSGRVELERCEQDAREGTAFDRAYAVMIRGNVEWAHNGVESAIASYERAFALADDPSLRHVVASNLAAAWIDVGSAPEAERWSREALAVEPVPGGTGSDPANRNRSLWALSLACRWAGRMAEADAWAAEATADAERARDPGVRAAGWLTAGIAQVDLGRHAQAAELAERVRRAGEEAGDRLMVAQALELAGLVALDEGDLVHALACFDVAVQHCTVLGRQADQIRVGRGVATCLAGDPRGLERLRESTHSPIRRVRTLAAVFLAVASPDADERREADRQAAEGPRTDEVAAVLSLAQPGEPSPQVVTLAPRSLTVRLGLALRAWRQ